MKTQKRVLGFLWFKEEWVWVDTWEGRKRLVSTAFKNGGRCKVMNREPLCSSPPISSYMASQSLTTFKNNYLMRWVNVRLFLSAPSIKQPLCNSFYSLRTSSGGVTSTLVLHPLDLIKISFQGKMLGITWLCVTCKCIAMLNVTLYATSHVAWMSKLYHEINQKAKKANKVRTVLHSLRGRRLKGKGKGVLGAREKREAREEGGRETPASWRPLFFSFLTSTRRMLRSWLVRLQNMSITAVIP